MLKATRTFIYLINDQGIFKNNVDLQDFFYVTQTWSKQYNQQVFLISSEASIGETKSAVRVAANRSIGVRNYVNNNKRQHCVIKT